MKKMLVNPKLAELRHVTRQVEFNLSKCMTMRRKRLQILENFPSNLSLFPSTNSLNAVFASVYGICIGGCLKQYDEMLVIGPASFLSRATFRPLIASIIIPALLYASITFSFKSSLIGIFPKYFPSMFM